MPAVSTHVLQGQPASKSKTKFTRSLRSRKETHELSQNFTFELVRAAPHLVQWLSAARGTRAYSRVFNLLEDITELEDICRKTTSRNHQSWLLARSIRIRLQRYRLVPQLRWVWEGRTWYFNVTVVSRGKQPQITIRLGTVYGEGDAVMTILRLAEAKQLDRLLQCEHCLGWFFARFRHQVFCKRSCQIADYHSSDAWRAGRREYMRRYRSEQKRRDEYERNRARRGAQ